jgi:hypothetical protein
MFIFTKYTAYNGLVGISEDGEVYDMKTNRKMKKEVHCGAIYFRSISSSKKFSLSKIEKTKIESRQQIKSIIFKQ